MKNYNIKSLAALSCLAMLAGCGENDWNDHLKGFEVPPVYSATESVSYTLTEADYTTLAGLSENKALATTDEESKALSAIGTNHCFATDAEAHKYIPALLASTDFPYFTANNGSSIKVTYLVDKNFSTATVETFDKLASNAVEYRVTEADYINAWGSDENFINGFAPMTPASDFIPSILASAYPDAAQGDMIIVSYNQTDNNPVFGGGNEGPQTYIDETFEEGPGSFTIDNVKLPASSDYVWEHDSRYACMKASGYVSSVNYETESWLLSPEFTLSDNANAVLTFEQAVNYFSSVETALEEASFKIREKGGEWAKLNVINIPEKLSWNFVSSGDIDLSAYNGKTVQIGVCYTSTENNAGTWEVRNIKVADTQAQAQAKAPAAPAATTSKCAVYKLVENKGNLVWNTANDVVVLQNSDYTDMGQTYSNLSNDLPSTLLPVFLKNKLPYAEEGDEVVVAYKYYANSKTAFTAMKFMLESGEWIASAKNNVTDQFNKLNDKWVFDPSVVMTLPASKGDALSAAYYQACVDWVYEKIDVPLGSTSIKSGIGYVTSYGNNEYYSGSSAYQNNVDLRAGSARAQYAKGYEGMTDEEVVELMKYRFCYEVFPAALSAMNPDAKAIDGIDVTFTVNFSAYTGSTSEYTVVYKVVGPAKFEFQSCTWWENGKSELAQ